jgi:hypothetical protein
MEVGTEAGTGTQAAAVTDVVAYSDVYAGPILIAVARPTAIRHMPSQQFPTTMRGRTTGKMCGPITGDIRHTVCTTGPM